jgi:hypothetical protein
MNRPIFILTDFGQRDYYVAAMKSVILSINPYATIVDITHNVSKWNILEGAFILWQTIPYIPREGIILGVVDPGVGTKRRNIIIKTSKHYLVGPDNGLLTLAANCEKIERVYEIDLKKCCFGEISHTFHGRDNYAPTAAYLSIGESPEKLSSQIEIERLEQLDIPKPEEKGGEILIKIIHIDDFGNIITNMSSDIIKKLEAHKIILISKNKKIPLKVVSTFSELEIGELGLSIGSSNLIEIVSNLERTDKILDVKTGDSLSIILG